MYRKLKNYLRILRRSLLYQTNEFFQVSTLHGVRYINETGRPFIEKSIWFAFTSIGAIAAFIIIMNLWDKFQTNPTITGVDSDFHYQKILFPTVVVCPMESFDSSKTIELAEEILRTNSNYDSEQLNKTVAFLEALTKLNPHNGADIEKMADDTIIQAAKGDDMALRKWVFRIAIDCTEVFDECKYRDEPIDCCNAFHPIYTKHGYCYSFNGRLVSELLNDVLATDLLYLYEMDKKWALYFLPKRPLEVFILTEEEFFGNEYQSISPWMDGETVTILGTKRYTITTDDTRQLSISQRKCYFSDEDALRYFRKDVYRYTSCMKRCRLDIIYKLCQCMPPYYSIINKYRYCTVGDLGCLTKYQRNITFAESCRKCHICCNNSVFMVEKLARGMDAADIAGVTVQFLIWPSVRFKREVLFGWLDLLVSFGGIAGLFLGFSVLSAVEIFYYFTIRAICMIYKDRRQLEETDELIRNKAPEPIYMNLCSWYSGKTIHYPRKESKTFQDNILQVEEFQPFSVVNGNRKRPILQDYDVITKSIFRKRRGFTDNMKDVDNLDFSRIPYLP